jgi:signal transduction histidine kinase
MKIFGRREFNWFDVKFSDVALNKYSKDELRRINITNYIGLISFLNMMLYVIIYSFIDFQLFHHAILFLTTSSFISFIIILINKKGYHHTARLAIAVFIPFFMSYISAFVFSKEPGFQVYLLLSAIIPIFMWSLKDRFYLIFFISLNILLYALLEFFPPFFETQIKLPEELNEIFFSTNIIICFLGFGLAIWFYQYFYNKQEEELIEQTEALRLSQAHKDRVYSIIAHDLRSPLGTFVGLTDLYLQQYDFYGDKKRKEVLSMINKSSVSLHELLENLLDWSKIQTGILDKNYTNFHLLRIVEDAVSLHNELIANKNLDVQIKIDTNIQVNADQYMVSTVFRNLISNAIKFTPLDGCRSN